MPLLRPSESWTQDVGVHQAWYWTYFTNELFARQGFPRGGAGYLLGGFWSLAVEEQFYLIWPFLVWILSRRALTKTAALSILASLLIRVWYYVQGRAETAYVLTFCRMDALAVGALVAVAIRHEPTMMWLRPRLGRIGTPIGAALLAIIVARHGLPGADPVVGTVGFSVLAASFGLISLRLFDHVGAGGSDLNAYDKYSCLTCYAGGVSGIRSLMGSGRPLAIDNGDRGDE